MDQKHSFSLLAINRKNKQTKNGEVPVYLRITCDSRRIEVSVKISLDPTKWNSAKGRVKGNTEEARRLNQSIETFEHRAREIYNKFILVGKIITADAIKNELIVPAAGQHCLVAEIEKFVVSIEGRTFQRLPEPGRGIIDFSVLRRASPSKLGGNDNMLAVRDKYVCN